MLHRAKCWFLILLVIAAGESGWSQGHPNLILTKEGVERIKNKRGTAPLFEEVLTRTIAEVDQEIEKGVAVPIPKDMSGGYTHERHKRNFLILQKAGNIYQLTGNAKYARYIKDVLFQYAAIYPSLSLHPTNQSYATGKIFWQCLNDANWLVYVSQAYDCIYEWLNEEDRDFLNQTLFRPLADFLSVENPQFFNRIHNHSTWGNAAVGMIGIVMRDSILIDRALYGLRDDDVPDDLRDDDNGLIKLGGVDRAGFFAQLDHSFSPDGYFTEGPYYLRYAIFPFLLFAKSLANYDPGLDIFNYRDGILEKSVLALLEQRDWRGHFFPLNDAQKGMSVEAREVMTGLDIIYYHCGRDKNLLSIAARQNEVLLDEAGFAVAQDISRDLQKAFVPSSRIFGDGPEGNEGGVAILRRSDANREVCLVHKYSSQGMGHGHFDKLSISMYDDRGEVLQDYGAARWVNIDQKGGGRYLPENQTFAKQTIAHNTLVIDEQSHFGGDISRAEQHHPELYYASVDDSDLQIISTKDKHAYHRTEMHRTLVLFADPEYTQPLIIDLFRVEADEEHQIDLPVWFRGHLLETSYDILAETTSLETLGSKHGYQHIWREGQGAPSNGYQITWFGQGRFYSMTSATGPKDVLILGRAGANDPQFNLRRDPVHIHRRSDQKRTLFASVYESHGSYNPAEEVPHHPFPAIESVTTLLDSAPYSIVEVGEKSGRSWLLAVSNQDPAMEAHHQVSVEGRSLRWQGPIHFIELTENKINND